MFTITLELPDTVTLTIEPVLLLTLTIEVVP